MNISPRLSSPDIADCLNMDSVHLSESRRAKFALPDIGNVAPIKPSRVTSADVLRSGDRFKMARVHAAFLTTEMVKLKPVRDRTVYLLIADSVSHKSLPLVANTSVVIGSRVSTNPDPAGSGETTIFNEVVAGRDRPTLRSSAWSVFITESRFARMCAHTTDLAMKYLHHRVTSYVEVARKGLEKRAFSGPSFYLDATEGGS